MNLTTLLALILSGAAAAAGYTAGPDEVRQTASGEVRGTASDEVRQTASGEVRSTALDEVRQTASGEVRSFGYTNPVIKGFHPDPSVCAVGEDYYLVNSSFQYFPGVPIFHSRDLVNWTQIGNVLTRREQLELDGALAWGGIYAPTIRYHEGVFYMITTNCSGRGNFIVHSEDPAGEWSDPVWIDQGGIDPSLFFHEGKCWYTGTCDNWIVLFELNPRTGEKIGEVKKIWRGTGGRYPEGPHLYFKDGWYYLLIAEGGTEYAHSITIARSRSIEGPYEADPANPVLTHCNLLSQSSIIQGLGHGDLVQAHDGSWWMCCLGFRTQGGNYHLLGRETFMTPIEWEEGLFPRVAGGAIHIEMNVPTLPQQAAEASNPSLDFSSDSFGPEWVHIRNPFPENYSFTGSALRLRAGKSLDERTVSPTFIGRRQEDISFEAVTSVEVCGEAAGKGCGTAAGGVCGVSSAEAGLTVYMDADAHYDIFLKRDGLLAFRVRLGELSHTEEFEVDKGRLFLRVEGDENLYTFSWSSDGSVYHRVGAMNAKYISTEGTGGFTGIILGLFSAGVPGSAAHFHSFSYRGL